MKNYKDCPIWLADSKQLGFTLVEVIITMGMIVGLAQFGMRLTNQQQVAAKRMDHILDITNITEEIRSILLDRESCQETFNDLNVNTTVTDFFVPSITQTIRNSSTGVLEKKEKFKAHTTENRQTYGQSKIKIYSYELETGGEVITPAGSTSGQTKLIIMYDKGPKSGGVRYIERHIILNIEIDPADALDPNQPINSCRSSSEKEIAIRGQHALYLHTNSATPATCPVDEFDDWLAHGSWKHSFDSSSLHGVTTCYDADGKCYTLYLYGSSETSTPECPEGWMDANIGSWTHANNSSAHRQAIRSCYKCP